MGRISKRKNKGMEILTKSEAIKEYKKVTGKCTAFLTGSYRYGKPSQDSDIDVAVSSYDAFDVRAYWRKSEKEVDQSNYSGGFKVESEGGYKINIIPLRPLDFVAWYYAALTMEHTAVFAEVSANQRHAFHEAFKAQFKILFAQKEVKLNKKALDELVSTGEIAYK